MPMTAHRPQGLAHQQWLRFEDMKRVHQIPGLISSVKSCCQHDRTLKSKRNIMGQKRQHVSHASFNLIESLRYNLSIMLAWGTPAISSARRCTSWMADFVQLQSAPVVMPRIWLCGRSLLQIRYWKFVQSRICHNDLTSRPIAVVIGIRT